MTTRETVQAYFDALKRRDGWERFLGDGVTFTSFTSPPKRLEGKEAFLGSTRRFYSSIDTFELRDLLVDGAKACALTTYRLRGPDGKSFASDVAEIFTVTGGRIDSFSIYFDSAPFPK